MDGRHVKENITHSIEQERSSDVTVQVRDGSLQASDSAGSFLQFSDAMDEYPVASLAVDLSSLCTFQK